MDSDYRSSKIAFVSGMTGSNITHINLLSSVALSCSAFHLALRQSRLFHSRPIPFILEWFILVVPLLLSITLFANKPGFLSLSILAPTLVLILTTSRDTGISLPSNQPPSPSSPSDHPRSPNLAIIPLPALTTYRAHMLLLTVLSILAVDFPVFPRSLAKCETFGVSLMDLGVGSFVFSQGLVSAIPLLKDPSYLSSPISSKWRFTFPKTLPIMFLGAVRVLLVKGTEYPEHESEYGTHWNFFITLALLPLLQIWLLPLVQYMSISQLGVLVALAHQFALSSLGMEDFVINAQRTNLISANKEGIVSLTGYMAVHLLGLSTGTLILPPSPSYFRRQQRSKQPDTKPDGQLNYRKDSTLTRRQDDKAATELVSYALIWWTLLGLTHVLGIGAGVSRRMVNLSYIFWVAAVNTSCVLGYLLLDMYSSPSPSKPRRSPSKLGMSSGDPELRGYPAPHSVLLDAVNKNGLFVFLIANVVTGLINLAIPTMYMSNCVSMFILCCYSLGICSLAWMFRHRRMLRL